MVNPKRAEPGLVAVLVGAMEHGLLLRVPREVPVVQVHHAPVRPRVRLSSLFASNSIRTHIKFDTDSYQIDVLNLQVDVYIHS